MTEEFKKQEFMSANQYAKYRNVSAARIKKLCKDGRFGDAAAKVGRIWQIDVAEADRILNETINIAWADQGKLHKLATNPGSDQKEALFLAVQALGCIKPENFKELCIQYLIELQEIAPDEVEGAIIENNSELIFVLPFPFKEILSRNNTGAPTPDLGIDFIFSRED